MVHVAGTNGKGSTSHLMASVLQEAGCKTGLYTSPHLKDFRERIKLDGEMISKDEVMEFVATFKESWQSIAPSFFEITVAMAFWFFKKRGADIVVLETGMGGRLDSTNIVDPEISVITNVGLDHQQFLGSDIESIAGEKAGIIKPNVPLIMGRMREEAREVVMRRAVELGVEYSEFDDKWNVPKSSLLGSYQRENENTAYRALAKLNDLGWSVSREHLEKGFQEVVSNTGLQGRWQELSKCPMTITDCGHNLDGWNSILAELGRYDFDQLHIVIGMVGDKDIDKIPRSSAKGGPLLLYESGYPSEP